MFLGCLIKRDKIAEELRAGLAGVGSHALLPQRCSFRLSRASCFCLPHPQARDDGPALPAPSVKSEFGGAVGCGVERSWLCPEGPEAQGAVSRRAGPGHLGGMLRLVLCTHLRPLHALRPCALVCCLCQCEDTIKCIFLRVLTFGDFVGVTVVQGSSRRSSGGKAVALVF